MKLVSTLILLMALFSSTALADGNMGTGGRGVNSDVKTNTIKGGMTTEDGDPPPPPPPPPCTPGPNVTCDDGNMGTGGRSAMMVFIQKYLFSLFG